MKSALKDRRSTAESAVEALNYARVFLYALESVPVIYARRLLNAVSNPNLQIPEDHIEFVRADIRKMIEQDAKNIRNGIYPQYLLYPESPVAHLARYGKILVDVVRSSKRFRNRKSKEFSAQAESYLQNLPKYYRRNFHFQTDGYLSADSANIYEHQTEILFRGTIALMRRLLLAPILSEIRTRRGIVKALEVGCGTGEASSILLESCPNIELTAVDLSAPYLEKAESRLCEFENFHAYQMDGAEIDSIGEDYDIVFSCFLFHELPEQERVKILQKSRKVLQTGGVSLVVDSIQMGDRPEYDWSLVQFPKDFHEPFYKNYVDTPLDDLFRKAGFSRLENSQAFFSKSVRAKV